MSEVPSAPPGSPTLARFLRERRDDILRVWSENVRQLPGARTLSHAELLDHLPPLLDRIAEMSGDLDAGREPGWPREDAEQHAQQRLSKGFDLSEVAREYALLRQCVLEIWAHEGQEAGVLAPLHAAIDRAIATSVDRYTEARTRTLQALDRISSAALWSPSLDELLQRLLQVFLETTAAADTAAILLREGDRLKVRAAVGLEEDAVRGFSVRFGEGFTGTVAAEREPRFTPRAAQDPLVVSPAIRARGVRALYGVPMMAGDTVIGVAHMGSCTAFDFSEDDQQLFRVLANRATAGIELHRLREEAERVAARLEQTAEFRERFIGILGHDLRGPLSTIRLTTEAIVRRDGCPTDLFRPLTRILTSAERMGRMIGDIIDFTRGRMGGGIPIHAAPMSLAEVCRTVADELEPRHPGRELRLDLAPGSDGSWDRDRLIQVVTNMAENAIQHGAAGTPVTIRTRSEDGHVSLEVHNEGGPIPADLLPHVFEPFRGSGVDPVEATIGSSLGLGLYIVREIVLAHGGEVSVRSTLREGTTFRATLPRRSP